MQSIARACRQFVALMPFALSAACNVSELPSDLETDGPPEVVEVNVATLNMAGKRVEGATFCRPGEEFKVSTSYCPLARDSDNRPIPGDRKPAEPVTDAIPIGWYVRFIFSELLDPKVEDLVEQNGKTIGTIAETQPATLNCGGIALAYDGWYDPTGNHLTYPPGPGLIVTLPYGDFVATGTACEVSLAGTVVDKDGEAVPDDQRGPYEFSIAPLRVASSSPANEAEGVETNADVEVTFNAPIDLMTATDRIALTTDHVAVAGQVRYHVDTTGEEDRTIVTFDPTAALAPGTAFTLTVENGITDTAGGALEQEELFTATFTTLAE